MEGRGEKRAKPAKATEAALRRWRPHFRGDNGGQVAFTGEVPRILVLILLLLMISCEMSLGQAEFVPQIARGGEPSKLPFGRDQPVVEGDGVTVLVPAVTEIWLLNGEDAPPSRSGSGVRVLGLTVDQQEHLQGRLRPFLGRGLTERDLLHLTEVIVSHYEGHDRPVVEVWVPEQASAALLVRVQEGRVGQVQLREGQHFRSSRLGSAISPQSGDLLRESALAETTAWLSRNPFRTAEVFAAPGAGSGEADLVFALVEERPWQVSASYENTGTEGTGQDRFLLGAVLGNAFAADQVLAYQATLGADLSQFQAHGLSWEVPIHQRHEFLRLTASWAEVGSELATTVGPAEAEGTSWQANLSYGRQARLPSGWLGEWSGGVEFKRADTFLTFSDAAFSTSQSPVDVVQLRFDILLQKNNLPEGGWKQVLRASLVASPGGLTGRNQQGDFAAYRRDAEPSYLALRGSGEWSRNWDRWTALIRAEAQLASGALLPSEQLGLGGTRTVRGYQEREFLSDSGWWVAAELRSPTANSQWRGEELRVQGVLFIDQASGWQQGAADQFLLSAGGGLRGQWGRASLRADLGIPLAARNGLRAHLGLGYRW